MIVFIFTAIAGFLGFMIGYALSEPKKQIFYLNIYKRGELYYSKTLWDTKREAEFEASGEPDFVQMVRIKI